MAPTAGFLYQHQTDRDVSASFCFFEFAVDNDCLQNEAELVSGAVLKKQVEETDHPLRPLSLLCRTPRGPP